MAKKTRRSERLVRAHGDCWELREVAYPFETPKYPAKFLGIDPGIRHCGVAVIGRDGVFAFCLRRRGSASEEEGAATLPSAILSALDGIGSFDAACVEAGSYPRGARAARRLGLASGACLPVGYALSFGRCFVASAKDIRGALPRRAPLLGRGWHVPHVRDAVEAALFAAVRWMAREGGAG